MYFKLDTDTNFNINKKNMEKLEDLIKNNSKYLIKLDTNFKLENRLNWGKSNEGFLSKEIMKQLEIL